MGPRHPQVGRPAKLFLAVEGRPWDLPPDSTVVGAFDRMDMGSYLLNPFGRPVVEVFFGGTLARDLEGEGIGALADVALGELAGLFGEGVRHRLRPVAASNWAADPWARGAYSYARPGGRNRRRSSACMGVSTTSGSSAISNARYTSGGRVRCGSFPQPKTQLMFLDGSVRA